MAITKPEDVFKMVSYAWGGLGASFGPIILTSLYWKKLNKHGVLAGMLTGAISTIIWKYFDVLQAIITERLAGFVLALAAVFIVTLLTQNKQKN